MTQNQFANYSPVTLQLLSKFVDKPRRKPKMKVVYGGEAEMVNNKLKGIRL